jgi:UDP-GlcNAc:undecaprenyl-phosphate GlcNAc-1-phosphate transferase
MLMWGHGHRRAVLLLWFWAAVAAFGSVSFVFLPPQPAVGLVLVMAALAGFLTFWLPRATIAGRAPADLGPDSP